MSSRQRVLSLYRRCLRSSRTWPGPQEEKEYILSEARTQFRASRNVPAAEAEGKLLEGEQRFEIAWHYLIPYPRRHHAPQFGYVPPPQQEDALESKLTSRDAETSAKLAAALKRRQQKLTQQE